MFPGLDLYHADPAQPLTTAGVELDDLDHDLSDLSVRGVHFSPFPPQSHATIVGGGGVLIVMHGRSRMTIDLRIRTMSGRRTLGFSPNQAYIA